MHLPPTLTHLGVHSIEAWFGARADVPQASADGGFFVDLREIPHLVSITVSNAVRERPCGLSSTPFLSAREPSIRFILFCNVLFDPRW